MQAAKDSFYMALRARLTALNPARTMVIDGVTVPAIVVRENMEPRFGEAQPGTFYLDFGDILIAESTRPMLGLDCHIWYASEGSGGTGVDRGRCWRRWMTSCSESAIRHTPKCAITAKLRPLIWDREFSGRYRKWGMPRETSRSRNRGGALAQRGSTGMRS